MRLRGYGVGVWEWEIPELLVAGKESIWDVKKDIARYHYRGVWRSHCGVVIGKLFIRRFYPVPTPSFNGMLAPYAFVLHSAA